MRSFDHPAFEAEIARSPYRLRFELSGGAESISDAIPYVPMFTRAFDRARILFDATFAASSQVLAIVGAWPNPGSAALGKDRNGDRVRDGFESLHNMGLPSFDIVAEWSGRPFCAQHRSKEKWRHRALNITSDNVSRDIMLWSNLAADLGIRPAAPVSVAFIDPSRGIFLHPYDDRGMDVIAAEKDVLEPLRRDHDNWILEYDRARIEKAFAS